MELWNTNALNTCPCGREVYTFYCCSPCSMLFCSRSAYLHKDHFILDLSDNKIIGELQGILHGLIREENNHREKLSETHGKLDESLKNNERIYSDFNEGISLKAAKMHDFVDDWKLRLCKNAKKIATLNTNRLESTLSSIEAEILASNNRVFEINSSLRDLLSGQPYLIRGVLNHQENLAQRTKLRREIPPPQPINLSSKLRRTKESALIELDIRFI